MWAERTAALPSVSARPRERPAKESLLLTEELIAQFLLEKERRGCVSDTVSGYRAAFAPALSGAAGGQGDQTGNIGELAVHAGGKGLCGPDGE